MKHSSTFLCFIGIIISIVSSKIVYQFHIMSVDDTDLGTDQETMEEIEDTDYGEYVKPVFKNIPTRSICSCSKCLKSHLQNDQGNFPLVENPNTCQEDNTACSDPCNETLLFRKPEFVWGKEINATLSKTVCESIVDARGSKVVNIHFSKTGLSMCERVCKLQDRNILRVDPTMVALKDHYCTKSRMKAATCVCVYKISCREFNHYAFIHVIPNSAGMVAIMYFEAGHPLYTPLMRD